jgi:ABC-type branched-subunit amino acid transport system ATPase component
MNDYAQSLPYGEQRKLEYRARNRDRTREIILLDERRLV